MSNNDVQLLTMIYNGPGMNYNGLTMTYNGIAGIYKTSKILADLVFRESEQIGLFDHFFNGVFNAGHSLMLYALNRVQH